MAWCHGMRVATITCMWAPLCWERGQQEHLSHTLCSSSQAGPAIPSLQGILSHSRPLQCAQQEEDPWQPPWVPQRCGGNKEVLGYSSHSGDERGKISTRNLLLFLPSPSPSETFCAWFFPALLNPVRQDGGWDTGAGLGGWGTLPLPCRVHLYPLLLQPGLLGKLSCFDTGRDWQTGLDPIALPSNTRLWHNLLVLLHAHGYALCSGKKLEVLEVLLLEVLRAVLISYPHLGTVASAPVAAPSRASPSARAGWDCPCCPQPCPGALQPPTTALKLLAAPGFPQLAVPTIPSA